MVEMRTAIILALVIISMIALGGDCLGVFGPNPEIGNTFGTVVANPTSGLPYIHDGIDIHFDTSVEIKPFRQGTVEEVYRSEGNPDAGNHDYVVVIDYGEPIGRWSYGHISEETAKALEKDKLIDGPNTIFPSETIGKLNPGPAGSGWHPHVHLEKLELRKVGPGKYEPKPVNPMDAFTSGELGCVDCDNPEGSYIKEPENEALFVGLTLVRIDKAKVIEPYESESGNVYVVQNKIAIVPKIAFGNKHAPSWIAPYKIEWGIDSDILGSFVFDGALDNVSFTNPNDNTAWVNRLSGNEMGKWNLTSVAGSNYDETGSVNFETASSGGYWNTMQCKCADPVVYPECENCPCENWEYEVPSCEETRDDCEIPKYADGEHNLWIKAWNYCKDPESTIDEQFPIEISNGNLRVIEIIKEQAGRRRPMSDENNLYVYFNKRVNPSTFDGNIDIKVLCHNMAEANIDSMRFSEDLTELTMFLPDTFYYDEAYHVELSNSITDIAGTPLDGNANCELDDDDNYETIVGTGYCNHTYIVQTGGYSTLQETYTYEDDMGTECTGSEPDFYRFYDFDTWGIQEIDHVEREADEITVEGAVFHMPWNKDKIEFIAVLSGPNSVGDTISPENIEQVSETQTNWTYTFPASSKPYGFTVKMTYHGSIGYWPKARYGAIDGSRTFARQEKIGCNGIIAINDCPKYVGGMQVWSCTEFRDYSKHMEQKEYQWGIQTGAGVFGGRGLLLELESVNGHTDTEAPFYSMGKYVVGEPYIGSRYGGFGCPDYYAIDAFHLTAYICGNPGPEVCDISYKATCDGRLVSPALPTGSYSLICPPGFDFTGVAGEPPVTDITADYSISWGTSYDIAMALGAPENFTITASSGGSARPETTNEETQPRKEPELPKEFSLGAPRPNPFNTSVSFDIEVPRTAVVDVRIYDILGNLVDVPIDRTEILAGKITEKWTCANCPSGIYFITMKADDYNQTQKMTLVK